MAFTILCVLAIIIILPISLYTDTNGKKLTERADRAGFKLQCLAQVFSARPRIYRRCCPAALLIGWAITYDFTPPTELDGGIFTTPAKASANWIGFCSAWAIGCAVIANVSYGYRFSALSFLPIRLRGSPFGDGNTSAGYCRRFSPALDCPFPHPARRRTKRQPASIWSRLGETVAARAFIVLAIMMLQTG